MPISVTSRTSPPSADLFLSALPAGTTRVRVWRVWSDQQTRVRGDEQSVVVGSETRLEDFDLPVGRAVAYWAQCFAVDGSELAPLPTTAQFTIALVSSETMWLSDPLAPALSRLVTLRGDTDVSRTYDSEVTYAHVIGHRLPVAIGGIRSAASDRRFTIVAGSFEESAAIEALTAGGGVLLLRTHPTTVRHSTGLIYLSAPQIVEEPRLDLVYSQTRGDWSIVGREVRPPGVSVVAPLRDYADVAGENTDYAGVVADYADYLALARG